MKVAFSTNAYISGEHSIIQALNHIADAGYEGAEILAENPLLWPFDVNAEDIRQIKTLLKERNLKPVNLNACVCASIWNKGDFGKIGEQKGDFSRDVFGPCFCDFEKENRELRIRYMKKVIDLAAELEIRDISTLSGFSPLRGTRRLAWGNMLNAFEKVVRYAEMRNVRINIEYEPGLLVGSAEEAWQLVTEINSPNFGWNFDIGHAFVGQEDIIGIIKSATFNKIHNVHIEDIGLDDKGRPVHYHLIPGTGVMPIKEICMALEQRGFQGWYIVELYTYVDNPIFATQESVKYMKKLKQELEGGR